jgi:hypothetical protein
MIEQKCKNCKYHDSAFSWVCVNADSSYCADFTDNEDWCSEYRDREDSEGQSSDSTA